MGIKVSSTYKIDRRDITVGSFDFPSTGIVVFALSQFDREIMLWFAFRVIFHIISEFYLIQ
jgi:hypothetical protein